MGNNQFKIDNIPFFITNLSLGGIVTVVVQPDGMLEYDKTVQSSSNSTIRIIFHDQDQIPIVIKYLNSLGASQEISHIPSLIAFNIPESVDVKILLEYLDNGKNVDLCGCEISALRWE